MFDFILFIIALVIVISVHEFCHAWVANRLGDPTPKYYGRLTLNPLAHLDLVGTIMLFVLHIGWGKPVPINPDNFHKPKRDSALVALAGPGSNFLMAFLIGVPVTYFASIQDSVSVAARFFDILFQITVTLGVFNLLPFPPLDGSKVVGLIIPRRYNGYYEDFLREGMTYFVVFVLVDLFVLNRTFGFSIIGFIVGNLTEYIGSFILLGTCMENGAMLTC